jgi:hypothetical protein
MNPSVESFGKILIEKVRDESIVSLNMLLDNKFPNSMTAKYLRRMKENGMDEYLKALVVCCVDDTLACLMSAIDDEILNLSYTDENNTSVKLGDELKWELAGWYYNWRETYSKELVPDLEIEGLDEV